jgi:hypothetical protein
VRFAQALSFNQVVVGSIPTGLTKMVRFQGLIVPKSGKIARWIARVLAGFSQT